MLAFHHIDTTERFLGSGIDIQHCSIDTFASASALEVHLIC
jgi:hypothetical protein